MADNVRIPLYQREIYGWLYGSAALCAALDRPWVSWLLSLGNSRTLSLAAMREVSRGQKVLQVGATFGGQIGLLAEAIGPGGELHVMDVDEEQLRRVARRHGPDHSNIRVVHQDAALAPIKGEYDAVICCMLLHELPIVSKAKAIDHVLAAAGTKGKAVFIDYHNPAWWHPLRYAARMVNRLYQPFAEKMWDREIHSLARDKVHYMWRKATYFGRMYQKVVVTKKSS